MASGPTSDMDFTKFFADMKLPALPDMEDVPGGEPQEP